MFKKIDWSTVLFSGLGTALLIFVGNLVYGKISSKTADIVYTISPPASFSSQSKTVTIHSGSFRNRGNKLASNVVAVIEIPRGTTLTEKNIVPNNKTLRFSVTQPKSNLVEIALSSGLNPKEEISFSLLTEGKSEEGITMDVRGTGLQGRTEAASKKGEDSQDLKNVMFPLILMLTMMLAIMIFLMKGNVDQGSESAKIRNLGAAYEKIGRFGDAVSQYRRETELDPDDGSTHACLAKALARHEKFDEALIESELAIELAPKHWYSYYCAAIVRARQGNFDETATLLKQGLEQKKLRKFREYIRSNEDLEEFRKTKHYEDIKEFIG